MLTVSKPRKKIILFVAMHYLYSIKTSGDNNSLGHFTKINFYVPLLSVGKFSMSYSLIDDGDFFRISTNWKAS